MEGILDADMISLLNSTPGIRRQSGVVRQRVDPSDWMKLLTMENSKTAVKQISGYGFLKDFTRETLVL